MSRVRSTKLEMHEFSFSVLAMLVVSSVSLSEKELHIEKKTSNRVRGFSIVWPEEQSQLDQEGKSPGEEE